MMKIFHNLSVAKLILCLGLLVSSSVFAQWGHGPQHVNRFHEKDIHVWRGGSWYHGDYQGRFGWYWVVGGAYYFYPGPIYPYPDPYVPGVMIAPGVGVEVGIGPAQPVGPPGQPSAWYYCPPAHAYYPYVAQCQSRWKVVPAMPNPR